MLPEKEVVGGVVLWWYLSFACNIFSQLLLRNGDSSFSPLLLTGLQSLVGCGGACVFGGVSLTKIARKLREEHSNLSLKIGVAHFVGNLCTNLGLSLIDVSAVHTVKAAEPIITAFLSVRFNIEPFTRSLLVATLLVSFGVALFSYKDLSAKGFVLGVGLTFGSNVGFAVRNLCIKLEQKEKAPKHTAIENFVLMSVYSFIISSVIWTVCALAGIDNGSLLPGFDTQAVLLYACSFHFFYNSFSLFVLRNLGLLSHAVANSLKRFVIILSAAIFFGTASSLSTGQIVGSIITCFGAGYFGVARAQAHAAHTAHAAPTVEAAVATSVDDEVSSPVPLSSIPLRPQQQQHHQQFATETNRRVIFYTVFVLVMIIISRPSMNRPKIPTKSTMELSPPTGTVPAHVASWSPFMSEAERARLKQQANVELVALSRVERRLTHAVEAKKGTEVDLAIAMKELQDLDPGMDVTALLNAKGLSDRICDDSTAVQIGKSAARIAEKDDAARAEMEQKIKHGRYALGSLERIIRNENRYKSLAQRQLEVAHSDVNVSINQIKNATSSRKEMLFKKILFFTGAGNINLGDDEMPAAWLAFISAHSFNWIPYFAIQQDHIADGDSPEKVNSLLWKRFPATLMSAGFTNSSFVYPALIVRHHDAEEISSFHDFDAVIIGGGGMLATGSYADFHSHNRVLSDAAQFKRPVFIAGSGAFYPANALYSTLLQQAKIISVRDDESMNAMQKYSTQSGTDAVLKKTRLTPDLLAAAPQNVFGLPSLNFPPLPQPVPKNILSAAKRIELQNSALSSESAVKAHDEWRQKFSICWSMKAGHQKYLLETLSALAAPTDYVVMVDGDYNTLTLARKFFARRQMFIYRQNGTDLAMYMQQKCKMVVSMALHGTIYAVRLGIPAFGLKAGKIEGALRHFGGDELVRACSTSTVVPSLAALVRCHMKYDALKTFQRIADAQETFAKFLRDVDNLLLTEEDLLSRRSRYTEEEP